MTGRGVATDVVEASARAYLNAVNKIVRLRDARRRAATQVVGGVRTPVGPLHARRRTCGSSDEPTLSDAYLREARHAPAPRRGLRGAARAAARRGRARCSISAPATASRSRWCSSAGPTPTGRRPRLQRRDARASARERFAVTSRASRSVEHDLDAAVARRRSARSTSSCRASRSTTACPTASARSTARCSRSLRPGGAFVNLEHVASPTGGAATRSSSPRSAPPRDDDPSNQLVAVEQQLSWLNEIGFANVDCFWKWRELPSSRNRPSR